MVETVLGGLSPSIVAMRMFTCASALRLYEQVFGSDGRANHSLYLGTRTSGGLSEYTAI